MNCWSHRPRSSRTSHSIDKPLFIRWWTGLFVFTIWSATNLKKNIWGRAHIWTPPISIPWLRPCSAVNGCRQNESPNSWSSQVIRSVTKPPRIVTLNHHFWSKYEFLIHYNAFYSVSSSPLIWIRRETCRSSTVYKWKYSDEKTTGDFSSGWNVITDFGLVFWPEAMV